MIYSELKSKRNEDICVSMKPANHSWSYLFDCGQASLLTFADCQKIKGICITHTHIDHFVNFMGVFRHLLGANHSIILCGPSHIQENVQGMLKGITWNLIQNPHLSLEIREIQEESVWRYELRPPLWNLVPLGKWQEPFLLKEGSISLQYALLDHRIPSIAYLLQEEEKINISEELPYPPGKWVGEVKSAFIANEPEHLIFVNDSSFPAGQFFRYIQRNRGYSVGYVMDHLASSANQEKLKKLYQGIDELYIEGYYRYVDVAYAQKNYHSTAQQSGALAREAGVKTLHLVHHSRRYAGEYEDVLEEGYAAFEGREPRFKATPSARFSLAEDSLVE
jgi:ribonuclease Z